MGVSWSSGWRSEYSVDGFLNGITFSIAVTLAIIFNFFSSLDLGLKDMVRFNFSVSILIF